MKFRNFLNSIHQLNSFLLLEYISAEIAEISLEIFQSNRESSRSVLCKWSQAVFYKFCFFVILFFTHYNRFVFLGVKYSIWITAIVLFNYSILIFNVYLSLRGHNYFLEFLNIHEVILTLDRNILSPIKIIWSEWSILNWVYTSICFLS